MEKQIMTFGPRIRNVLKPTTQAYKEEIEIPDRDDFGEKFPREYAPPAPNPGEVEPVIIPPMPQEEEPKEAMKTITTQEAAKATIERELKELEEEEEASYQAYLKKYQRS